MSSIEEKEKEVDSVIDAETSQEVDEALGLTPLEKKIEKTLKEKGVKSEVHERAYRNRPLTEEQKISNRQKSKIRVRVEHIFGQMTNGMRNGLKMRSIGIRRITGAVGLLNLVYNRARYEQILRWGLS